MQRGTTEPARSAVRRTVHGKLILLDVADAPACSRNPVLKTGYRPPLPVTECFSSIFTLHNETVNIWSHLLGGLGFLALLISETCSAAEPFAHLGSYRAFYCAVTGVCFLGSALFHVLACNPTWYAAAWVVDLAGMFALIGAGGGSNTYFVVGTHHGAWPLYLHTGLSVGCAALAFALMARMVLRQQHATSSGTADEGALRGVLPALLVCLSYSYWLVAVAHVGVLEGSTVAWRCFWQLGPEWFAWGSGMLFIWKMRIPEIFAPYRFDIFGASHQIHHMVCIGCAAWHLSAVRGARLRLARAQRPRCQLLCPIPDPPHAQQHQPPLYSAWSGGRQ